MPIDAPPFDPNQPFQVIGGGAQQSGPPSLSNFDPESVDSNLTGTDYLKQYPAEVQAAVREYMAGGVMPTGNPRAQGITTMAKTVAQKMAMDAGNPELADDALYSRRRQMQVDLSKTTSPQQVGGQITFGGTALGHLATYAESLADLNNYNGGITPIGHAINAVRGMGPEQAGAIANANGVAQHYGQEIAKFYGGGSSGEAERSRFLQNSDPATKTSQELAGMLRAERNLIPERFDQIRANIANVLGADRATQELARVNMQPDMARINAALARLDPTGPEALAMRGQQPNQAASAQGAAGPVRVASPQQAIALRPGTQFIDPNGVLRVR